MMGPGGEEEHDEFMPEEGGEFGPPDGFEGMQGQFPGGPPSAEEIERIRAQEEARIRNEMMQQYGAPPGGIPSMPSGGMPPAGFTSPPGGEPTPSPGGGSGYAPAYDEFAFEEEPAIGRDAPSLLGFVLQSLAGILGAELNGE